MQPQPNNFIGKKGTNSTKLRFVGANIEISLWTCFSANYHWQLFGTQKRISWKIKYGSNYIAPIKYLNGYQFY